ncbi:MAG TPA: hypothetical protein VM487_24850 [Phycisphaerae bacterium]|nr:hypothetical protein [Phycisphaerae bacterium]
MSTDSPIHCGKSIVSLAPAQVRDLIEAFDRRVFRAAVVARAKAALRRQIDATDRQIDRLVYELYGLTDEEIRIVEEATR